EATIENDEESETKISGLGEGTYVFILTVKDDQGATATDEVKVEVKAAEEDDGGEQPKNQTPVAAAGKDMSIRLPEHTVTLDGSASKDKDGKIVSYNWSQQSGPAESTIENDEESKTKISGLEEGTYVFVLTVKDDQGATATDKVKVEVKAAEVEDDGGEQPKNQTPVAAAGKDLIIRLPEHTVTLDG